MKINVLDSSIYNLISAGEVVERPASVVKELVENAIDAGAKNIKIDIVDGGKTHINVIDDGSGIEQEDLEKAFLPHATSKIAEKNDLFKIKTLGFRGEALPSISSVSMVRLSSKTNDDDCAYGIELRGGKITSKFLESGVRGTNISVDNLFFLTPARLKFMKKDKSEESEVTALISNLILANPNISFTYSVSGKNIYKTSGTGLKNAINEVFPREIAMNFVEIENTIGDMSLHGYVSKPTYFKGNRSYQTTIINGRVIENKTITTAVEKAFEPFMMKRSFPLFVLDIKMPYDSLDVNVHPSKFDVRFSDNHAVFSFIYHSVSNLLMRYDDIKDIPQLEYIDDDGVISESHNINNISTPISNINTDIFGINDDISNSFEKKSYQNIFSSNNRNDFLSDDGGAFYRMIKNRMSVEKSEEKEENTIQQSFIEGENNKNERQNVTFDFVGRVIGQLFETYILVEKDENLYIIDQHAAHERILFDKLMSNNNEYSQPLLIPYIYTCGVREFAFISEIIPSLTAIGFDISEFSNNSFKVNAVPETLIDINFDKFFEIISRDFIKIDLKDKDFIKEKLMQTACKSAIKAGDTLSNQQIDYLLKSFANAENKPLQCPHGRPTVIKFSKTDFEKWFKRIV